MRQVTKLRILRWADQVKRENNARSDFDHRGVLIARVQHKHLVRIGLPSFTTARATEFMRNALQARGIETYTGEGNVIQAAGVVSVDKVIANKPRGRFLGIWQEAPESLVLASVRQANTYTHRQAYFLAGFDSGEWRQPHFFCELPPGFEPTTIAEAYEALKPEAVRMAEKMRRRVKRQGDLFAIPVPSHKSPGYGPGFILDTNHLATDIDEVEGEVYVRGTLKHRPSGRHPDHTPVRLGRTWHLIVKNTVPIVK